MSVVGEENITSLINKSKCFCLNEDANNSHVNLFSFDGSAKCLESDCDEQLLLHLEFQQTVKLNALQFETLLDDTCPCRVKLFINKP